MRTSFCLQFPASKIEFWAHRYSYEGDDLVLEQLGPKAQDRGFLIRDEFLQIGYWKSPRSRSRCEKNSAGFVEEVTRVALGTESEELKIGVLTLLSGVSWPTASVILHFCSKDPYPILDYRALSSLGLSPPPTYNFPFWWKYTCFIRDLSRRTGHDLRTIDRALWQYSKENQEG